MLDLFSFLSLFNKKHEWHSTVGVSVLIKLGWIQRGYKKVKEEEHS